MNLNNQSNNQQIRAMGCLKLCIGTRQVKVKNSEINLTGLEFNLLNLLMIHSPNLLPRLVINQQLFQGAANKEQTTNMHISNLRKKLLKYSSGLCIRSMRGQGYYLVIG
jgi:two-component system response regulator CpxR